MDKESQVRLTETLIERLIKGLAPDEIVALALQTITSKYQKRFLDAQDSQTISRVDSISGEGTAEEGVHSNPVSSRAGTGEAASDVQGM